jgi:hypothetical protein
MTSFFSGFEQAEIIKAVNAKNPNNLMFFIMIVFYWLGSEYTT